MTNSVIGALRVNLGLDTAEFADGMKRAQGDAEKFAAGLKTAFMAVAATVAAGMAGAVATVSKNLTAFDDLSKESQKIGVPVEQLSKLRYVADMSGVSAEGLSKSVGILNKNLVEAASGSGAMAGKFKALGVTVQNADGSMRKADDVLLDISDRFAKMPDGAQKSAMAMAIFGKSGADLIPLLNGGAAAIGGLMDEAKGFGLEVSTETARMAEAVNDNISRVGYAFSGLGVQMTAALAPVLLPLSDFAVELARMAVSALDYLPQVAEAAAVVGGSLLIAFSPALLSAVYSMSVAIGVGMVGAVRALTAAMLANPLGALAVGIAAAITAAYYFRDEIQKAIGIDVVQIAKDAGNYIIQFFFTAFNDIKFLWVQFPNIIGGAAIGAVNAVIRAINDMVSKAKEGINLLIDAINKIPGVSVGLMDSGSAAIDEIENTYAKELEDAAKKLNETRKEILDTDYIGNISKAFQQSSADAADFSVKLDGVNAKLKELDASGAGGSGGGKAKGRTSDPFGDIVNRAEQRLASMRAEQQAIGMTEEAAAALRYETEMLNAAQGKGLVLSSSQTAQLSGLAQSMAGVQAATQRMKETFDFAKDATKGFLSQLRQGLQNGESFWKSFGNAAMGVLNKILDKLENELVDALFSMSSILGGKSSSGGGGFFSAIFGGIGKLFGFASGGTILPGGTGGIDSQLVAFRKSPNERVDITKPGQTLADGRGGVADIRVSIDQNGNLQAFVERVSDERVAGAAPAIISQANSQVVPTLGRFQAQKAGGDWRNG